MHGGCDGDVGKGDVRTGQPFVFAKSHVHDSGSSVELFRLFVDGFLIWLGFQERLDDIFDQVDIADREPCRSFPQQPSVDICAMLEIFGV